MKSFILTPSIISFKYKNGTITATDMRGSYGSMSKLDSLTRTFKIGENTIISYTGEYSDITFLHKALRYELLKDEAEMNAKGMHKIIQRILYTQRSRMKPLNVGVNIIGYDSNSKSISCDFSPAQAIEPCDNNYHFLGNVNKIGNFFYSDVICTGLGSYITTPYIRGKVEGRIDKIERDEAIKIIEEAMRLLIYRDCSAMNKIQIGIVEDGYCSISEPYKIETSWELGRNTFD